jgi:hypothetical protein
MVVQQSRFDTTIFQGNHVLVYIKCYGWRKLSILRVINFVDGFVLFNQDDVFLGVEMKFVCNS